MKTNSEPPKKYKTNRNLLLPKDVDRYMATKLQVAIRHMDNLLATNPTQFNAKAYYELLQQFGVLAERIKRKRKDDKTRMVETGELDPAAPVGEGTSASVDPGISAENPFTR